MRCDKCKWWKPAFEGSTYGECHWDLPKGVTGAWRSAVWPETDADDFCGEFEPSEEEK